MKVICNTTPFIALSSIDQLGLLKEIYSSIIVPRAVIEEINEGGNVNVPDLTSFDWIEVIPNVTNVEKRLLFQLDYGEQQVVLNALRLKPDKKPAFKMREHGIRYSEQLINEISSTLEE